MSIGQNIKRLRQSKGLTQAQLASILEVSNRAVSAWENDLKIPRMDAIDRMAEYFGVLKSYIIEDTATLSEWESSEPEKLTLDEMRLLAAYREADEGTKRSVRLLLGIFPLGIRRR